MTKARIWKLTDLATVPKNGLKVFSCFHGGGGSTMGYKLAGFDVLGGVEIDPKMMQVYRANHKPRPEFSFQMGVQDFCKIDDWDLHEALFDLDILDGSPPCSSFSMAGAREKLWGKEKKFREGQAEQVLDDLFFSFLDVAAKLKPKVIIAENVKGLISGNARGYVKMIFARLQELGYTTQLFLLNAADFGVPQYRSRVFFIASKGTEPRLELHSKLPHVPLKAAFKGITEKGRDLSASKNYHVWEQTKPGHTFDSVTKNTLFTHYKLSPAQPSPTLTGNYQTIFHWETKRTLSRLEVIRIQSFPEDFDFLDMQPGYVCGMSVPPFMTEKIAKEVAKQWFGVN